MWEYLQKNCVNKSKRYKERDYDMKKALMNASVASMIYKFNMDNINLLEQCGYKVDIACNFGNENPMKPDEVKKFENLLKNKNIKIYKTNCPRNIFSFKNIFNTYKELKKIAKEGNYDLVHTQSPIGGVLCRLAFRNRRNLGTKIIYTAHGFHFYKGGSKLNWLIFYPIEKICSYFTDVLITINKEDYKLAKKNFHAKKIVYVPGVGVNPNEFDKPSIHIGEKKKKLGIRDKDVVLLSVGELNDNKNHRVIIRALGDIKRENAINLREIKYLICGQGEQFQDLKKLVEQEKLEDQVQLLGFRTDMADIYKMANIFVFPSFREGLSVALMEAMWCGLPVICSRIRGNIDLVDKRGGIMFDASNVLEAKNAIMKMIKMDTEKRNRMGIYNKKKIKNFSIEEVNKKMLLIYSRICTGE